MTLNDLDEHPGYNCLDFETCSYKSDRTTNEKKLILVIDVCAVLHTRQTDGR